MISTMRERMSAKLGNSNDNAFKMRKLFKMYDKQDSGLVSTCQHIDIAGRAAQHSAAAYGQVLCLRRNLKACHKRQLCAMWAAPMLIPICGLLCADPL